jgi:hypothetical protein
VRQRTSSLCRSIFEAKPNSAINMKPEELGDQKLQVEVMAQRVSARLSVLTSGALGAQAKLGDRLKDLQVSVAKVTAREGPLSLDELEPLKGVAQQLIKDAQKGCLIDPQPPSNALGTGDTNAS